MKKYRFACWLCLAVLIAAAAGCGGSVGPGDTAWQEFVAPYRHDVKIDALGFKMHYIDIGAGEPIVLVHGFADSTYCFHENVKPLLAAGYRVILIDQPAMGRSEVPPDPYNYTIENQAGAVAQVIAHLGLERYTIGGSSLGGAIALYLALTDPKRVSRVVPLDPTAYSFARYGMAPFAKRPGLRDIVAGAAGRRVGKIALWDVYYDRGKVDDVLVDQYARPMNKPGYRQALVGLLTQFESDEFTRMTRNYWKIDAPTLIVWGDTDRWVPPEFGRRLHRDLKDSQLEIIKNCGHLPHQERPEVVNPLLLSFLEDAR